MKLNTFKFIYYALLGAQILPAGSPGVLKMPLHLSRLTTRVGLAKHDSLFRDIQFVDMYGMYGSAFLTFHSHRNFLRPNLFYVLIFSHDHQLQS